MLEHDGIPKNFVRITSNGFYLPELDGLRFLAIASVFLFHVYAYLTAHQNIFSGTAAEYDLLQRFLRNGGAGVPLFFVISGFTISLPFASHSICRTSPPDLTYYFCRRLTRIEAPYALCMVIFASVLALTGTYPMVEVLHRMGAGLLYLNSVLYGGSMSIINEVVWSLEVEVQFYVLAPVLCMSFALGRMLRRGLFIGAMLVAALLQCCSSTWVFSPLTVVGNLQYFAAGLLIADLYLTRGAPGTSRQKLIIDGVGCAVIPLIFYFGWKTPTSRFLAPFLMVFLCYGVLRGVVLRRLFSFSWIVLVGSMCYSLYLIHLGVIKVLSPVIESMLVGRSPVTGFLLAVLFFGGAVVLAGAGYYRAIERPCMNTEWPARLAQQIRATIKNVAHGRKVGGR